MHEYLRAIGFSQLRSRRELDELLHYVMENANRKLCFSFNESESLCAYERDFGEGIGIAVIEVVDEDGYRTIDSYYPYTRGANYLYNDSLEFEHLSDREGYAGICDEINLGIPLIFHVNNPIEYLRFVYGKYHDIVNSITLSGMAKSGTVILAIEKDERQESEERQGNERRNEMIDAARAGDVEAMEQLTLDDMDTYTLVTNRSKREDIFTIVSSYFMPYSVECDKYSVLGRITDVREVKNRYTRENVYYLSIECNSIYIDLTIAKEDLMGTPKVGRRFKGILWLQGEVDSV